MHQILVYADSLSWGIIPNTRNRFSFDVEQHLTLGKAMAKKVKPLLSED